MRVIVSTHSRTRKHVESRGAHLRNEVELLKPLRFIDYVDLQQQAKATLSDRGTITQESSIVNLPGLNIRNGHDRPEGMEEGAVIMIGLELDRILDGLAILGHQSRGAERTLLMVRGYDVPRVSEKVMHFFPVLSWEV